MASITTVTEALEAAHAAGISSSWAHQILASKGPEALLELIHRQQAPAQPVPDLPLELPADFAPTLGPPEDEEG